MFSGINSSLFDNAEFKEDSVREVIILPILNRLGYTPSGHNRVVRSKSLVHPFIYVGTNKLPVKMIPDYTLLLDDIPKLILDAKSPKENIISRSNVQQAYSYAIHPEIKSQYFALCNGKELAVFSVDDDKPMLHLNFADFESRWNEIESFLSPKHLKNPILRKFSPDFGCALFRSGLLEGSSITLIPARLNLFARLDDDMITAAADTEFAEKWHCVSFDFNRRLLPEMLAGLPVPLAAAFSDALSRHPFQAAAELAIEVDIDTRLGSEINGPFESYRPLIIEKVLASRFDPLPLSIESTDIPNGVFRLRKAFSIKQR